MTDELLLDPEMESEAQALANYEDELRDLAEEVNAIEEDIAEHESELIAWKKVIDEIIASEECNKKWILLENYSIENFRLGKGYESLNEEWEDDWFSIVNRIEYGSVFTDFHVSINHYSGWWNTLFINFKSKGFTMWMQKDVKDFYDWIDKLNEVAPLINNLIKWDIQ